MELISQHNHTNMCPHAKGSIEEVIAQAHLLGFSNVAITEHYPLTHDVDTRDYVSMPFDRLDEYVERIQRQRRVYPDMEILIGCELDWLGDPDDPCRSSTFGEDRTFTPQSYEPFDIILGSVHFIDRWPIDDPDKRFYWDEVGADYLWRRYFEVWCEAATSQVPFTVMSHPDLIKKYGFYPSFNPYSLYQQAAEAAQAGHRMIEVNTSGVTYSCAEMFPNIDFLREFCRAGVPCTIGTDSHKPEALDLGIRDAYRLLYEAGYREVTVVTPGGSTRRIALQ